MLLDIPNFNPQNFEDNSVTEYLESAKKNNYGIILDLRNNPGGTTHFMREILQYFRSIKDLATRYINASHLPLIRNIQDFQNDFSKENMKSLIKMIIENMDQEKEKYMVKNSEFEPSIHEQFHMASDYYKDKSEQDHIQGKIAILINEETHSNAEVITMVLKESFPDRVKTIGKKSYGGVLIGDGQKTFSDLKIDFMYPTAEVISIQGTRIEGVGIQPDIETNNDEETMKIAEEWVTSDKIESLN